MIINAFENWYLFITWRTSTWSMVRRNTRRYGWFREQRICSTKDKSKSARTKNINTKSKLPISLVQIKTEITNSEKFKNEIKQLLYSLHRSKKMNKTIYNDLINTIWKWKQSLWTLKIVAQVSVTIFFVNLLTRKHDKNLPT